MMMSSGRGVLITVCVLASAARALRPQPPRGGGGPSQAHRVRGGQPPLRPGGLSHPSPETGGRPTNGRGPRLGRRVLPLYDPAAVPEPGFPLVPVPIPGEASRTLRYTFRRAADLRFVRDVRRVGAFVHVLSRDDDKENPNDSADVVGVVVDVQMAAIADDGESGAIVGRCRDVDARVRLSGRGVVKQFPYAAAQIAPLRDAADVFATALAESSAAADDALYAPPPAEKEEDDDARGVLSAKVVSTGDAVTSRRDRCVRLLSDTLRLAEMVDPNLGARDALGTTLNEGEYRRMRVRLEQALETFDSIIRGPDDDATERADRELSFLALSVAHPPRDVVTKCVSTTSAAHRYAAISRYLEPRRNELAALAAISRRPVVSTLGEGEEDDVVDDASSAATPKPPPPERYAPRDAPPTLALLRPGRRLKYWWGEDLGWTTATVRKICFNNNDDDDSTTNPSSSSSSSSSSPVVEYLCAFDHPKIGKAPVRLPLATADRDRWHLLAL